MRTAVFLSIAAAAIASGQILAPLVNNGPAANRVDVVIVGDGYTQAEMTKLATDARNLVDQMFAQEPLLEYSRFYNVTLLQVASAQSGADHPSLNIFRNTAFDAAYDCAGIARLICVSDSKVTAAISAIAPDARDMVIVLVNDSEYGGSGGRYSIASTNASVVELVLHESAHSFGLLADEYGGPPPPACVSSVEPPEANATRATVRDAIKWKSWIAPSTPIPTNIPSSGLPGLYQGARYCDGGLYRPTYNSKMRSLGQPYEQINGEQLIRRIYNFVDPIETSAPAGSGVTVNSGQIAAFSVTTPRPRTHDLVVTWSVDGVAAGTGLTFNLPSNLTAGTHTVEAVAADPTDMVRNDPGGVLRQSRTWSVTVVPACSFTFASASASVGASGGSGSVALNSTGPSCAWTAASDSSWLTVTPAAGTGNGVVNFSATANPSTVSRTAKITAGGQTFTVTQGAVPGCSLTISPLSAMLGASAGASSFSVTAPTGCSWTAASTAPWITIANASGTGAGTVSFTAAANNGIARTARIAVGGTAFVVTQSAAPGCTLTLGTPSATAGGDGGVGHVALGLSQPSCGWTAVSDRSWLQVYPLSGTGNASLSYTVYPNFSSVSRSGTVTVGDASFPVTQQAGSGTANERLVRLLYFNFLGRLPSAAEVAFQLGSGTPRHLLAFNFLNSAEFNNAGRFVAGLYVGILNRNAEYGGWLFQRNALANGQTNPDLLVSSFLNGAEFAITNGQLNNAGLVRLLYRQILGREASAAEVTWREGLLSGGLTRVAFARDLLSSTEFRQGKNARLLAFLFYATLLNRGPGSAEFTFRRDQVQANSSDDALKGILLDVVNSTEFNAQVN